MKLIPLTQGKFAMVDDDVYEWASKFKWHVKKSPRSKTLYAARNIRLPNGKRRTLRLHREILQAPPGVEADHFDGNGLNNLNGNIRLCSGAKNACNRGKQSNNTSAYVGVSFHRRDRQYQAYLSVDGRRKHLGYFDTAIEAARARDAVATLLHGAFARLNFPPA